MALLSVRGGGNAVVDEIDLNVHAGEIVAVIGLEGSGKTTLARAIFGGDPFTRGQMRIGPHEGLPGSPRQAIGRGIGFLPDDRKADGLALRQSVLENALMALRGRAGLLSPPSAARPRGRRMAEILARVDLRAASTAQQIRSLSGGNQQKTVLARWLAATPRLLVCAEPTRGIDVAAKAAIYHLLREFADAGQGVLIMTSDLPEAIGIADRLVVMRNGRIAGVLRAACSEEEAMALATGHQLLRQAA